MPTIASPLSGLRAVIGCAILAACAPSNPETAATPVQGATRRGDFVQPNIAGNFNATYTRRPDDGVVIAKVVAPAPAVWEAVRAAFATRKITPTVMDRATGRMGDTTLVLLRNFNGKALSTYFSCGSSMSGQRADEDRLRSVLLAQTSRLAADTIAIALHFSAHAEKVSSSSTAQCMSNGRAEGEFLDEVLRRVAAR